MDLSINESKSGSTLVQFIVVWKAKGCNISTDYLLVSADSLKFLQFSKLRKLSLTLSHSAGFCMKIAR